MYDLFLALFVDGVLTSTYIELGFAGKDLCQDAGAFMANITAPFVGADAYLVECIKVGEQA